MNRLVVTLLLAPVVALAQSPIPPPSAGLLVSYAYWPTQYIQFVGPELPYSMLELDVDSAAKQPVLYVTLTDRATGKRIHYTNSDAAAGVAKAQGEEVHKTEIAFEAADTQNTGSLSDLRFTMADGKPLQWHFVQGSDITEQGSGLTPLPSAKIPVFAYREQGAVAGEGTALQIGDTVSAAQVWKEISQPPYFIAYHGALTQSAHTVAFIPGAESWKITSSPAALTPGLTWELDAASGNHRSLKIDRAEGTHAFITATDRFQPQVRFTLDATRTPTGNPDGWTINSVRYFPARDGDKHFITLDLPAASNGEGKGPTTLSIGKKKKQLAEGTLTKACSPAGCTSTLQFTTPTWVQGKTMKEQTTSTPDSLSTTVLP